MPPAARITDFHACPMVTPGTPPIPHVGGPIIKGSHNVLTGKLPQARLGDMAVCVGPPDTIVKGSSGVFVNKMPAARIGDSTAHGGTIVAGLPTVIIGESKSISGGGAAVAKGALMLAYSDFVAQLKVLIDAQRTGVPFCEACFKAAQEEAAAMQPAAALPSPEEQPLSFAYARESRDINVFADSSSLRAFQDWAATLNPPPPPPPNRPSVDTAPKDQKTSWTPPGWHPPLSLPKTWPISEILSAQNTVRTDPDVQPTEKYTYCNLALTKTLKALGAPFDEITNRNNADDPILANDMAVRLRNSKNYVEVTAEEAQQLANDGLVVIAAAENRGTDRNGNALHGHVGMVRPLSSNEQENKIPQPVINNVGSKVGVHSALDAFGSAKPPKYYVHR